MMRIDFYVQHLVKHKAIGVELMSGKPVKFEFPNGPRMSSKPIEHTQIAQLVQEAAPPMALEALRTSGRAQFFHKSEAGMDVEVAPRRTVSRNMDGAHRTRARRCTSAKGQSARRGPGDRAADSISSRRAGSTTTCATGRTDPRCRAGARAGVGRRAAD